MPLIITILVTLIVIIYVRSNKRAKQQWLTTLDLPGRWVMQTAEGYLQLQGGLSEGTFTMQVEGDDEPQARTGNWHFSGNLLVLSSQTGQRSFKVNFFRAGVLSLEDPDGTAMLYHKAATNVVPIGTS